MCAGNIIDSNSLNKFNKKEFVLWFGFDLLLKLKQIPTFVRMTFQLLALKKERLGTPFKKLPSVPSRSFFSLIPSAFVIPAKAGISKKYV